MAAIPYAHILYRDARQPGGAITAAGRAAADAVGLLALLVGSVHHRSLLL
jgi:hypothetical protein